MRPAGSPESAARRVVGPGEAGVVSRPGLWERLGAAGRVMVVSAPAGSGKTVLLRSRISEAHLAERAAWVPVGRDERAPQTSASSRPSPGSGRDGPFLPEGMAA